jgi:quercetin dioxygenase-like cupin family protein
MRAGKLTLGFIFAAALACTPQEADELPPPETAGQDMQMTQEWVAAPGLPAGAEMMVMSGNPAEPGPFTVHLRVPNDYRFPPHTHSAAETVTPVSGLLHVGMGETFDMSGAITELRPGQSQEIAANEPHFAHAAGETVIEVRSTGPFEISYVNPADAPPSP